MTSQKPQSGNSEAYRLYRVYSLAELTEQSQTIRNNPDNRTGKGIHIFPPEIEKKLDTLAWAITFHLADRKTTHSSHAAS